MGQQIIRQPNGKYAIWSSIVDDLVGVDFTRAQLVNYYVASARHREEAEVKRLCDALDAGETPWFQFTERWTKKLERSAAKIRGETR